MTMNDAPETKQSLGGAPAVPLGHLPEFDDYRLTEWLSRHGGQKDRMPAPITILNPRVDVGGQLTVSGILITAVDGAQMQLIEDPALTQARGDGVNRFRIAKAPTDSSGGPPSQASGGDVYRWHTREDGSRVLRIHHVGPDGADISPPDEANPTVTRAYLTERERQENEAAGRGPYTNDELRKQAADAKEDAEKRAEKQAAAEARAAQLRLQGKSAHVDPKTGDVVIVDKETGQVSRQGKPLATAPPGFAPGRYVPPANIMDSRQSLETYVSAVHNGRASGLLTDDQARGLIDAAVTDQKQALDIWEATAAPAERARGQEITQRSQDVTDAASRRTFLSNAEQQTAQTFRQFGDKLGSGSDVGDIAGRAYEAGLRMALGLSGAQGLNGPPQRVGFAPGVAGIMPSSGVSPMTTGLGQYISQQMPSNVPGPVPGPMSGGALPTPPAGIVPSMPSMTDDDVFAMAQEELMATDMPA